MRTIHRILAPVDFSEHSQRALDEAIELARSFGAELHLLHCHQLHPSAVAPYGIVVPRTFDHDVRMAALQRLSEWRDQASARGIRVLEHITARFPSEEIAAMAERLDIDLIVMGTRGLTGFRQVLLGSVAERTIRTAPCPVLTVKTRIPELSARGARWGASPQPWRSCHIRRERALPKRSTRNAPLAPILHCWRLSLGGPPHGSAQSAGFRDHAARDRDADPEGDARSLPGHHERRTGPPHARPGWRAAWSESSRTATCWRLP